MLTMLADERFFAAHRDRKARIRLPLPNEEELAFHSLGPHDPNRRRILVLRVPDGQHRGMMMPIPFLAFADEEIADRDDVLLPIIHEIMLNARKANDNGRRR